MSLPLSQPITRRGFLKTGMALAGMSMMPGPVLSAAQPAIRIGYLPITDATPLLVAHSLGYFQEEGLNVERPVMVRSWKILTESFLAGKFNFTHMLFPIPVWMRFSKRIPVKVLAWDHTNGSALTVAGSSGIRGFADLGGRQIAVPSWYSMHNLILQLGLRTRGLTPVIRPQQRGLEPNEVNLFILPPPEMPPALLGGKVDGFIVAEPFNALAEMRINARIMRFTGDIWKNHPCCVIVAPEELPRTYPALTQKAVNAVVRAQLWCRNNRLEAAHLLSRDGDGYLPVPHDVLKRVFTGYDLSEYRDGPEPRAIQHPEWGLERIDFQPYPYRSATRFIIEEMAKTRVEGETGFLASLDPSKAADELVDDRFVFKAMKGLKGFDVDVDDGMTRPLSREEIVEID